MRTEFKRARHVLQVILYRIYIKRAIALIIILTSN